MADRLNFKVQNDPEYSFGFAGFGIHISSVESPCTSLNGHLWEQQPMVLLSNPPQNVYRCVQDGCSAVRNVLQKRPTQRLVLDSELKDFS